MKIGILYPRSGAHPEMMPDFIDGIKTALHDELKNDSIKLISESVGFGGVEKEVYEKAEKLLVLEGADILVAFIDLRVLELLKPLFYTSGKLVLMVNAGANYPQNWVPQPNILTLSLQHGFLCWLTGKWAGQPGKKNAAMATTFYDGGYLHTSAIVRSFMKSGGKITYNFVNNQKYDDAFDINQLTGFLSGDKDTDSLLCIFDSLPAYLLYSRLNTFEGADKLKLFVSPMMLEPKALEGIGDGFKFSICGHLPWHAGLENNANRIFIDSYSRQTKRSPSVFSLLGWEAALIVQQVMVLTNDQYEDGADLAGKLSEVSINSPRGEMKLDTDANYFLAPIVKCTISPNSGNLSFESMETPLEEWSAFKEDRIDGIVSGWTNTYLSY
jgi:hypothetical protein